MLATLAAAVGSNAKSRTISPTPAALKNASGPVAPMKPHAMQLQDARADLNKRPTEFVFQSHFDEEGALFFLGTFGKKRLW